MILPILLSEQNSFCRKTVDHRVNLIPTSPRHLSRNLSSEICNSLGFLPRREAPGISFSLRNVGFETFEVLAFANEEERDAIVWPF